MNLVGFKALGHKQQTRYQVSNREIDDRALPPEDFAPLQKRFRFTFDVAASPKNAKLPRYFTHEHNGLSQSWANERIYCNPPYSEITPWVAKAWLEVQSPMIVLLLPANRTEQGFWQDMIEPYRDRSGSPLTTEFWRGRTRFLKNGQASIRPNERPPFAIVLCIWSREIPVNLDQPLFR